MNLYQFNNIFQLIDITLNIIILIISIFFYKALRERDFVILGAIFLLENIAIVLDNNKIYFISKYIYYIYFGLILSKIIIIHINQYKNVILKYTISSILIIYIYIF